MDTTTHLTQSSGMSEDESRGLLSSDFARTMSLTNVATKAEALAAPIAIQP